MSKYTISLLDIIRRNQTQDQDITNLDDLLALAKNYIFDKAPIDLIRETYRDRFILGFTLHFLEDEIGLETIPLWKMKLAEKLVNNQDYINLIYENLDKQIFGDYSVTENTSNTTTGGTTVTEFADHNQNVTTTTNNLTRANTGTQQNQQTRNLTSTEGGTETVDADGTLTKSFDNYREQTAYGKTSTMTKGGTETTTDTYNNYKIDHANTETHSGYSEKTSWRGSEDEVRTPNDPQGMKTRTETHKGGMLHHETDHATDSTQAVSNTPQSGVQASEIMSTTVTGTTPGQGSVATPNQTGKKYLSGVQHQWNNDRAHESWDIPFDAQNGDVHTVTEQDTMGEKITRSQTEVNASHEKIDDSMKSTINAGSDTHTGSIAHETGFNQRQDNTQEGGSDSKTFTGTTQDTKDDTTTTTFGKTVGDTGTVNDQRTDNLTETNTGTVTVASEGSSGSDQNVTSSGTNNTQGSIESYRLSSEMVMRAEPFLKKIWKLFDDIFMLLI